MPNIKLPSTLAVLSTLSVTAAAWETYTVCDRERANTFSAVIRKLAEAQPFIPFMFGMLCRHLFGETCRTAFFAGWLGGEFWPLVDKEELAAAPEKT